MARGVRQGCPTSGSFLQWPLTRTEDGSRRQIIPKNPDNLDFLQPAQCAYADDLAVASSSLRGLMTALALRSVDSIAGRTEVRDSLHGSRRIAMNSVRCKLFDTPNMLEP